MEKGWRETYKEKEFTIDTTKPSEIVVAGFEKLRLPENFKVLDLGCGNGRNSIYAATLGGLVESVDLVDLDFKKDIPEKTSGRISFHEMSVMDFDIKPDEYTAVIASRLFQYLTKSELEVLFGRIKEGLTNEGLVMVSYTASGGIFDKSDIHVLKYKHAIDEIRQTFQNNGLEIVLLEGKSGVATHVPYENPNETYGILIKRKIGA
ncbi:MAG TPA: hypothetical protein DEB09_02580 [Candidatus Magasanikbacteria bacterium]|nr:hypothetical protein [Candidatus Magasanikbacteria bacterium]